MLERHVFGVLQPCPCAEQVVPAGLPKLHRALPDARRPNLLLGRGKRM